MQISAIQPRNKSATGSNAVAMNSLYFRANVLHPKHFMDSYVITKQRVKDCIGPSTHFLDFRFQIISEVQKCMRFENS